MTLEERFREECTIVDAVGIIDAKQCVSITDEQMIKFAEWLQENRWFSFTGGFWYYTFEHGTAMSDENYNKHYRKTTSQLLSEYKRINNL